MTRTAHTKIQVQRSLSSEDKSGNKQMEGHYTDCVTSPTNAVANYTLFLFIRVLLFCQKLFIQHDI